MKPTALLLATAALLAACAGSSDPPAVADDAASNGTAAPAPTDEPPAAAPLDLPPADEEALAAFFDADGVAAALAYDRAFRAADDGAALKAVYDQAFALADALLGSPDDDAPARADLDAFRAAAFGLPGLTPDCVAECTEPVFQLDLADWGAAARHAGASDAGAFFDRLVAVYDFAGRAEAPDDYAGLTSYPVIADGELVGWPAYRTQTWDYGGYSTLGSGAHRRLLDGFVAAPVDGAFAADAAALREGVVLDLLEATCIGPSAAAAADEVLAVSEALVAPDVASASYDRRLAALDDPDAAGLQTDCADLDAACSCAAG